MVGHVRFINTNVDGARVLLVFFTLRLNFTHVDLRFFLLHRFNLALVVLLVGLVLCFLLFSSLLVLLRVLFFLELILSISLFSCFPRFDFAFLFSLTLLRFLFLLLFLLVGALMVELLVLSFTILEETLKPSDELTDKIRLFSMPVPLRFMIISLAAI